MGSWLVEDVARGLGVPIDRLEVLDVEPSDLDALAEVCARRGLLLAPLEGGLDEALGMIRPGLPLVAQVHGAVWLVLGRMQDRVRVRTGASDERWLPLREFQEAVGDRPRFAIVEAAFPFDPEGAHDHGPHTSAWTRLARLIRLERSDLWIVLIYAVMVGGLSLVVPVAVQTLVNTVVFGAFLQPLFWLSVLMFAGLLASVILQVAQIGVVEVLQRRVFVRLVAELTHRIPRVTQETMDTQDTSILVNRFFDVLIVQKSLAALMLDGVGVLVAGVTGTMLLALYSPWFLVYAAGLWVALGLLIVATGRRAPATAIDESYAKHDVAGWLEQVASNPALFRSSGASGWAARRGDALARRYLRARDAHFQIWIRQLGGLLLLAAFASTVLLGLGGWLVISGALSIGQLLAAELVVTTVLASFAKLGKQLEKLYDLLAALDKIGVLLDLPLERNGGGSLPESRGAASLEVRDLRYGFSGGRALFDDLSFAVQPGERVALVGTAGTGRGTLLDLVLGSRQAHGGVVRVDGVDLRELSLASLRARVALVRGLELVQGSVADNVRAGRTDLTDHDVRRALADAGLLEEVATLPGGIHSALGPSGRPLSGSRARLLVLARALASRPGLLLVDELIDTLPPKPRAALLDALFRDRSSTVLVVTRDPEVIARCDRSLVFERPRRGRPVDVRSAGGVS